MTLWRVRKKRVSILEEAAAFLGVAADSVADLASSADRNSPPSTFVPNSEPTPITCRAHAYARTSFGLDAARRIMRAAGAMDRHDANIDNFLFLTATLPGDTEEAKWAIANYSHFLIDRLKSWLSKRISDRKEFYVWEHQGRGALHFHYCIYCPIESIKQSIEKGFKRQWVRMLDALDSEFGVNMWGRWKGKNVRYKVAIIQARVERVYKSVGAYMAGYLSGKGSKHEHDKQFHWFPKRWFGVSRPLSKLVQIHTEKCVAEFGTLKEANEFWYKKVEANLDDALTHRPYPHKIGEGKTHVFYHTPEQQAKLWQENQMLTHSPTQHPLIAQLISLVLTATLKGQKLVHGSPRFRAALSPESLGYFEDVTYSVSLKRGAISQTHLRGIQAAFTTLDLSLGSTFQQSSFGTSLRKASLMHSLYHSQMKWNQHGWLKNDVDFVEMIDETQPVCQARTSAERRSDSSGGDGPRGHVPSGPTPDSSQLSLL